MTDYPTALAAAREAHTYVKHLGMTRAEAALGDLLAALDAVRGEAVVHLGRYFCDGPEGHFWCDSLTHARKFVDAVDADHEWTITTVAPPADDALADTQRAIIEAAERRGYERGLKEEAALAVSADFTEWLAREMPAGTVIGDPRWWASMIARRFAQFANKESTND